MNSPERKTYSPAQIAMRCVFCLLVAIALAILLRESPYWHPLTQKLGLSRGSGWEKPEQALRPQRAYDEILAQREVSVPVEVQDEIMKVSHRFQLWSQTHWLGFRIQKNACDLWMMQQLIHDIQPDYVVETGTCWGGSALYFAHMLKSEGLDDSKVLTVDITSMVQDVSKLPLWQEKVEFLLGSSTAPEIVNAIAEKVKGKKVIVALDSDHSRNHVLNELKLYSPLVSPGSYIVVEDTNMDGIPLAEVVPFASVGPGPMSAVLDFLESEAGADFTPDLSRERMVQSFNPGGWLKRSASSTPSVPEESAPEESTSEESTSEESAPEESAPEA